MEAQESAQANGNQEAWKRLINHVHSGWFDPGSRMEAVLETVMFLRNNKDVAEALLTEFPQIEEDDVSS